MSDQQPHNGNSSRKSSDDSSGNADGREGIPLALFGGPASGKSFLFQAMAHRCQSRQFAGALVPLLGRGAVTIELDGSSQDGLQAILHEYTTWQKLGSTQQDRPTYYRLSLPYSTGWLGGGVGRLVLELPDLAGEIFTQGGLGPSSESWHLLATSSRVLIFCLPFWAAFPSPSLSATDREERQLQLHSYERVVQQVMTARQKAGARPALILLALTMADDRRCGLDELREFWLPEADLVTPLLLRLREMRALMAYLQDARKVSSYLERCFACHPTTARLTELLEGEGYQAPWILPVTAVDRRILERDPKLVPPPAEPPTPVHVELPLLLALCEQTKALL